MSSTLLATIHLISVNVFLLIYLVKTILLFANQNALLKFTRATKVIEMIVSTVFLVTGVWLVVSLGAIKTLQLIKFACILVAIPLAIVGFKKMNKGLALFSFVLIVASYGLAEMSKKKPYIPSNVVIKGNTDSATQLGIKTYVANCAMCHGLDGKKMYRDAFDLSASVVVVERMDSLIRGGSKGKMPAFAGTLNDQEIAAVSAYIITLRH